MTRTTPSAVLGRALAIGLPCLLLGCESSRQASLEPAAARSGRAIGASYTNDAPAGSSDKSNDRSLAVESMSPAEQSGEDDLQSQARARVDRVLQEHEDWKSEWLASADESTFHVQDTLDRVPDELQARVDRKIAKKLRAGPQTGAADAAAYFMDQRVPKGEPYPIERVKEIARVERAKAARIAEARSRRMLRQTPDTGVSAQLRGSDPVIDGWRALGPGNIGGRTRAMVIAPDGPGTGAMGDEGFMLAAGVAGGVFKSTDGGASWRPTSDLLDNIAVNSLAMDPTDPNIIYAGTGEGYSNVDAVRGLGIFKSEDAGETWRQLEGTVEPLVTPFAFHYVNKIQVSPTDPLRIYAATRSGVWIHRNGGEMENDDGDTFQWELRLGNPFYLVGPFNSRGSTVGATDLQVQPVPASGGGDGEVDEEFLLASFGSFVDDGLFASADGGDSWFRIIDESASSDDPFKIDSDAQGRMSIAFSNRAGGDDPGVVYVLMSRSQSFLPNNPDSPDPDITRANDIPFGAVFGVYRADLSLLEVERDGNDNVTSISLPFERRLNLTAGANPLNRQLLSNALANGICGNTQTLGLNQGWYDAIIKVDPANRNIVWVGGIDLFRSDDGGRNFGLASYWYFDNEEDQYVHADQHEIVFHPEYNGSSNTTMYVTNDGGVFRTDDARGDTIDEGCPFPDSDTGESMVSDIAFVSLNNGYEVTQFYHGAAGDSIDGGRDMYVGGTQDNGTIRTLQRRCTEDWTELLGGDGGYVAVDPTNNNNIYAETQRFGNIYRIRNTPGAIEQALFISNQLRNRDNGLFITPFAMDPNNPATLWTGGTRPWRTMNATESRTGFINWSAGPNLNAPGVPPLFDTIGRISAIAIAPSDSSVVYVGTEDGWIARTEEGTAANPTWQILSANLPIESGYISSIAVDPNDPNSIWVTNARFTPFDPNNPIPDSNLYRGDCMGTDCDNPMSWFFRDMDGVDCDTSDEINPVLPDVPAHWVAIRRCDSGGDKLVFVGTEIGVYVSTDAYDEDDDCDPDGPDGPQAPFDAVTWQMLNVGIEGSAGDLPSTVVEALDFRDDNTIVAFTHGRGAFLANILRECNGVPEGEPCSPADLVAPFGVLDQRDITAWVQDTAQGRLSADMPPAGEECGDGTLDLFDISRFVELQQAGCDG